MTGDGGPAELALQRVAELLGRAVERWEVGTRLPPMARFNGVLRELALPPARLVLRVAQLVTRDQREFNQAMVGAVYELAAAARALHEAALKDRAAAAAARAALSEVERRAGALEAGARAQAEATASLRAEADARLSELKAALERLSATVARRDHLMAGAMEAAAREGRAGAAVEAASRGAADALYADFEDKFRGARELIEERAAVYVPLFRAAGAGAAERPILDLGCGRGELLELLRRQGLSARGVDTSSDFVQRCRELGLEVEHADALSVLRRVPDGSLGAVTAIHVIEHLPLPDLSALLGESARALAPGGLALFETPNPRNLTVGAYTFYMDPTHLRPLPPELMAHLLERAGFRQVRILPAHPDPRYRTEPIADPTLAAANEALFGPQDYAVVGTRT